MYTFEDRGGRSLTLRPEATAPIARAYLEHGLHREPQPVKLYTIAPMYRYEAPQRGRYREHWQLSVEAIGSPDPALDAELIQLYAELLDRLGVTGYELQLNSIGDANCRPAYLERLNAWLDAHDDAARRRGAPEARDEPAARLRRQGRARRSRRSPTRRRSATRSATTAASTSSRCARYLDVYGVPYTSCRRSCAGSTTTRAPPSSSSTRRSERRLDLRRRPLRRADRADRRPADAGRRLRRRHRAAPARARGGGRQRPSSRGLDVFVALRTPSRSRRVLPLVAELRARRRARRHRLRRPLAQGPAHAGATARRRRDRRVGPGALDDPPRRTGRRRGPDRGARAAAAVSWRDLGCGELRPRARRRSGHRSRAGSRGAATTAGSSSSTCATRTGIVQLVINPEHAPEAAAAAHELRNEFVLRAEGEVVARAPETRQPGDRDRRGRGPGRRARDPLALPAAAVPARRGERRRDAAPALPLARPAPRALQRNLRLRAQMVGDRSGT